LGAIKSYNFSSFVCPQLLQLCMRFLGHLLQRTYLIGWQTCHFFKSTFLDAVCQMNNRMRLIGNRLKNSILKFLIRLNAIVKLIPNGLIAHMKVVNCTRMLIAAHMAMFLIYRGYIIQLYIGYVLLSSLLGRSVAIFTILYKTCTG
jgi:hypothetical protein